MTAETWAKALTAMGETSFYSEPVGNAWEISHENDRIRAALRGADVLWRQYPTQLEALAAACDALSLPWQQHPVWQMHRALEWMVNSACGVSKAGGPACIAEVADAIEAGKSALDAAKGGG